MRKGMRPLNNDEILKGKNAFKGRFALRNLALYSLIICSGFRISETLSLKIKDVWQFGRLVNEVEVKKRHMKCRIESRRVPLHKDCKPPLQEWLRYLQETEDLDPEMHVFHPQSKPFLPLSRQMAWEALTDAYKLAQLPGGIGCHGLRKTFAEKMYPLVGYDMKIMQTLLGHKHLSSTANYIGANEKAMSAAWEKFSLYS